MLAFPGGIRIYLAVEPVDMRKQFNGMWVAVAERLQEDPKSGAVYVFINKERTRLKCYRFFSDRTNCRIGLVAVWGILPGWHRILWPNCRALIVPHSAGSGRDVLWI